MKPGLSRFLFVCGLVLGLILLYGLGVAVGAPRGAKLRTRAEASFVTGAEALLRPGPDD